MSQASIGSIHQKILEIYDNVSEHILSMPVKEQLKNIRNVALIAKSINITTSTSLMVDERERLLNINKADLMQELQEAQRQVMLLPDDGSIVAEEIGKSEKYHDSKKPINIPKTKLEIKLEKHMKDMLDDTD